MLEKSVKKKDPKGDKGLQISMNGFISTSRNEKISLEYASNKLKKCGENDVVIMYEVTIDPKIPSVSYADIAQTSFHPEEEEILFNMGSTFQIDDIVPDRTNPAIKRIQLTARDFHSAFVDEMKSKLKQASQAALSIQLVQYLIELGEDRVCKRYLKKLVADKALENDLNLVKVFNCFGIIYLRLNSYGQALESFRSALNTQARLQFADNNALAEIFNYIGQTHLGLKQLEAAEQNLEEGVRIQLRVPKISQQHLASLYCNLGQVAYERRDWDEADKYFTGALNLYNRSTKISHDTLEEQLQKADLCVGFGYLKSVQNRQDPTESNKMFEEALDLYECILPPSHSKVAETYISIICEYTENKHFSAVIKYYEQHVKSLLKDYQTKPSTSQRDLVNLYYYLGACYTHKEKFDDAVKMWEKSMEHGQRGYLDELLSSARVPKVMVDGRLIDDACRLALSHYQKNGRAKNEHLAVLYAVRSDMGKVIEQLQGQTSFLLAWAYFDKNDFEKCLEVCKQLRKAPKPDYVRLVGLLVALSKTKFSSIKHQLIELLLDIEKELKQGSKVAEAERVRMIINDYLADAFLQMKNYDKAKEYDQASFQLKQGYYSAYHPSLTRNYQFMVSWCLEQTDFNKAVESQKQAIEVQLENMPSNHPDIRANYFQLGNCYCRTDKLELALDSYERAKSSKDSEGNDDDDGETNPNDLLAMHSCLADVYVKRKDFDNALSQLEQKINLSEEILPTWIVKMMEEKDEDLYMSFDELKPVISSRLGLSDGSRFGQYLQNLVYILSSLGRALLETCERSIDGEKYVLITSKRSLTLISPIRFSSTQYSTESGDNAAEVLHRAIDLRLKLTLFEGPSQRDFGQQYEELVQAYQRLNVRENEHVRELISQAFEAFATVDQQRALECRYGNLYYTEANHREADRYWRSALKKVKDNQPLLKSIIEKMIRRNKVDLQNSAESHDEHNDNRSQHEETEDEEQSEQHQSRRASSTGSARDNRRPEEYAQAYIDLGDDETALKYLEKYMTKLEETNKSTRPEAEMSREQSSLVRLYYGLMNKALQSAKYPNEQVRTEIAMCQKFYSCAERLGNDFELTRRGMLAVFRISKKADILPKGLKTLFKRLFEKNLDDLEWDDVAKYHTDFDPTKVFLGVAEHEWSNDRYDRVLKIYLTLREKMVSDASFVAMINYGILTILKTDGNTARKHRKVVETVDIKSPVIPILDRILLCRLIISSYEAMKEEEKVNDYQRRLVKLYREEWPSQSLKDTPGIGQQLIRIEHPHLAFTYWQNLQNLYVEVMPKYLRNRLDVPHWTFEELYQVARMINDDLSDYLQALAEAHASMADCYMELETKDKQAQSLEKAIVIGKKMKALEQQVQMWQKKWKDQKINAKPN